MWLQVAFRSFLVNECVWPDSDLPLTETVKANDLEPWAYLNYLFEELPAAKSEQTLLALLPPNSKKEDLNG